MQNHVAKWTTPAEGHLSRDANGDEQTDYARWRLVDKQGRQSWCYLESNEENEKWPQTIYEKYFLRLHTGLPDLPKASTPLQAARNGASECSGPMFILPFVVIAWYVTDTPIPAAYAVEIKRHLFARQNRGDGGWGWHLLGRSSNLGTVLNYVVLHLLGASEEDPRIIKARRFLHSLGGAVYAPGIAKFWLCVLGVIEWECPMMATDYPLGSLRIRLPLPPRNWYIHTRTNFMSLSYVWSKAWRYPGDAITEQLRTEIHTQSYITINFAAYRSSLSETTTVESAEKRVWEMIQAEDKNTEYIGLSPISKAINLIVCYIHDGSDTFINAHGFLNNNQLRENVPDQHTCYRWHRKGGWPFSTKYQGYIISEFPVRISTEQLQDSVDCLLKIENDTGGFAVCEQRQGSYNLEWLEAGEFAGNTIVSYNYVEYYRTREIEDAKTRGLDFIRRSQKPNSGWYRAWGICFTYAGMFALEALALTGETYKTSEYSRKGCEFLVSKQKEDGGWGEFYLSFKEQTYIEHEESQVVQTAWFCLGLIDANYPDKEPIRRGLKLILSRQQSKGQ
ncbi:family 10 polysaccharide lyase [Aspergillus steynii IBT 23096]|uniref:Family 10 polysaccharide lyase n=1 Tax=Aspergillus steynii IBT 23096 TaxID=1392250 RepID=A0A2I2FTZ0_9EURO|nr:family 10 polysaccharide lyase [Aspergillus steynii IBT 23096]PLB44092.1 family 10 polysaccharide lyase [Aspergillus steynii IBT 23096]